MRIENRSEWDNDLIERTIGEAISAYEAVFPTPGEDVMFVVFDKQEEYLDYLNGYSGEEHHFVVEENFACSFVFPENEADDPVITILAEDERTSMFLFTYFQEKDQGSKRDMDLGFVDDEIRSFRLQEFFYLSEMIMYEYSRLSSYSEMMHDWTTNFETWFDLDYILHDTLLSNYRSVMAVLKMAEPYLDARDLHSFWNALSMKYSTEMNQGHERNQEAIKELDAYLSKSLREEKADVDPEIDVDSIWRKLSHASENGQWYGSYYSGAESDQESDLDLLDLEEEPSFHREEESYYEPEEDWRLTADDMEGFIKEFPEYEMDLLYVIRQPEAFFEGAQFFGCAQGVYDYLKGRMGFADDTWRMPERNLYIRNVIGIPFYEYVDPTEERSVVNSLKMITMLHHIEDDFKRLEEKEGMK